MSLDVSSSASARMFALHLRVLPITTTGPLLLPASCIITCLVIVLVVFIVDVVIIVFIVYTLAVIC